MTVLLAGTVGTWERAVISPPLSLLAGDVVDVVGSTITQRRGNTVIATRQIASGIPFPVGTVQKAGSLTEVLVFEQRIMPGQQVTMTRVRENQTTGAVIIDFSSGTETEYASWADLEQIANQVDGLPEFAEKLLLAKAFRESPGGENKTTQIGASVGVNCLADVPVTYTKAT